MLGKQHGFLPLRDYVGESTYEEKMLICSCGFIGFSSQLQSPATFVSKFGQLEMKVGKPRGWHKTTLLAEREKDSVAQGTSPMTGTSHFAPQIIFSTTSQFY